ncbi:replication initiation protein, partial [Latilactobacillus curvatus]|nr:replication initiation protein [Latilactobacillus curvatus]
GKITGYKFSWKPERKDANDFSNGKTIDQMRMLENIEKNGELSDSEKFRAIDKVKGLPLGTTEREKSTKKERRSPLEDLRSSFKK